MMVTATVPPLPDSRPATVPRAPQGSDFSQRKIRDEATQSGVLYVKSGVLPVKTRGLGLFVLSAQARNRRHFGVHARLVSVELADGLHVSAHVAGQGDVMTPSESHRLLIDKPELNRQVGARRNAVET